MINNLVEYLRNKKILILGFGREGFSSYQFLKRNLPEQEIYISDKSVEFKNKHPEILSDSKVHILPNEEYLQTLNDFDIIMKSPGISFKDLDTTEFADKIKSQVQLFLEFVNVFTIGVTGTKGKSTTSSLIYSIISNQRQDVHLLGNIGVPLFDEIDELTSDSIVVLELSSHQLEYVKNAPNIAIILNLFEEHLDHYKSYEHYINAKLNIARFQNENDYFLYSIDNECLKQHVEKMSNLNQHIFEISFEGKGKVNKNDELISRNENIVTTENGEILYTDSADRKILGDHNFSNIMFAITVAQILCLDLKRAEKDIYKFAPLAHRMEFVGEIDGVKYYNDSIATIPASTINGVETLKNVNTLIIGGKDRGIDYTEFAEFLNNSNIENLICLPDTGWAVANMITNTGINKFIVNNMQEAVKTAKEVTKKGSTCLLSPAASSYGFYKNFEERGNLFKELVKNS